MLLAQSADFSVGETIASSPIPEMVSLALQAEGRLRGAYLQLGVKLPSPFLGALSRIDPTEQSRVFVARNKRR
jgi:hypothetical protein